MNRRLITFLAITFCFAFSAAVGQLKNISVSLGGNYPLINTVSTISEGMPSIPPSSSAGFYSFRYEQPITIQQESAGQVGLAVSGSFDYFISPKFFVSSGLSLDYLRFKQSTKVTLQQNAFTRSDFNTSQPVGTPFGSIIGIWDIDTTGLGTNVGGLKFNDLNNSSLNPSNEREITTIYISIPITIGTSFFKERLIVRTGINVSYMVEATTMKQGFNYQAYFSDFNSFNPNWTPGNMGTNPQPTTSLSTYLYEYKDKGTDGFQTLQVSAILKTTYMLTKHWGIDFTSQFYFSPIYSGTEQTTKAKFKTFSLGASYRFK